MMSSGEDKRRAVRVPVDFPVRYTFENKELEAHALNLSPDGMFLKTDYMLLQNDIIEIYFQLEGIREPFWMKARVAWGTWVEGSDSHISGMGVEFLDPLPSQKDELEQFLQKLLNR